MRKMGRLFGLGAGKGENSWVGWGGWEERGVGVKGRVVYLRG